MFKWKFSRKVAIKKEQLHCCTSWLSFVMSNCEFVTFPLVSWVKCGSWLYQFLIFALFRTWKDGNLLVYSRKFTNNHVKISKKTVKNICILYDTFVHVRTLFGCEIVIYLLPNNLNICFGCSKEPSHWEVFQWAAKTYVLVEKYERQINYALLSRILN